MSIYDHLEQFHGLPTFAFPAPGAQVTLPAADSVAWRVSADVFESEETWLDAFARFVDAVDTTRVRALLVGIWAEVTDEGTEPIVRALVDAKDRFPALRGVFLGDIVAEESEISWIAQSDVTPLLTAFPALTEFAVRGGEQLEFPAVRHTALRSLTVQTGGLGGAVVRSLGASDLPALEHLEIWFGSQWYGGDATVADLEQILSGARLPALTSLALRNSEIQDEIAAAVASAPVVARLETLDLSLGALGDEGVEALLSGQPLTHLKKLDLHHHFVSDELAARLRAELEPAGVTVDLSEHEGDSDAVERYISVSE